MKYYYKDIQLITAYFLSKNDRDCLKDLGYSNLTEAFKKISDVYEMKWHSLKLYRDEFDKIVSNKRVGFKRASRQIITETANKYEKYSYNDCLQLVKNFINDFPNVVIYDQDDKNDKNIKSDSEEKIDDIENIKKLNISKTTKTQLVKARLGQGEYRKSLLKKFRNECFMTGITINELLIASHIKPWSESNNNERLDPNNGLLLSSNMDKLFDKGLISFTNDCRLLTSPLLKESDLIKLNLSKGKKYNCTFNDKQKEYLSFHRRFFGFDKDQ